VILNELVILLRMVFLELFETLSAPLLPLLHEFLVALGILLLQLRQPVLEVLPALLPALLHPGHHLPVLLRIVFL